jgi:hypothetical protein
MRKLVLLFLILGMMTFCSSCKNEEIPPTPIIQEEDDSQQIVIEEKHSEFYMEGYSVEDVLKYFNEVVLDTEYTTGEGDATLVQRWDIAIRYQVIGDFTEKDIAILENFFAELNKVEGFAGVSEATESEVPNLYIYFEDRKAFNDRYSEFLQNEYADGATRYWYYTETNDIYEGTIGYCTDMADEVKDSVLLEEIVNCLGIGDSTLREDSIVYQYGSSVTNLSKMDWLIIRLLYNPRIRCGMDIAQCEEVIRELYY